MTMIKLTQEIVVDDIYKNEGDFTFEGEEYKYVEELDSEIDDNGRDFTYLYQRKSDAKFFMITVTQIRYGYEDYGYESWANECELIEVEKREKVITTWEAV